MSAYNEIVACQERVRQLETLGRKLTEVIEDFLPNIGRCVVDIGRLNEALIESTRLLGPGPSQKKKAKR